MTKRERNERELVYFLGLVTELPAAQLAHLKTDTLLLKASYAVGSCSKRHEACPDRRREHNGAPTGA